MYELEDILSNKELCDNALERIYEKCCDLSIKDYEKSGKKVEFDEDTKNSIIHLVEKKAGFSDY